MNYATRTTLLIYVSNLRRVILNCQRPKYHTNICIHLYSPELSGLLVQVVVVNKINTNRKGGSLLYIMLICMCKVFTPENPKNETWTKREQNKFARNSLIIGLLTQCILCLSKKVLCTNLRKTGSVYTVKTQTKPNWELEYTPNTHLTLVT